MLKCSKIIVEYDIRLTISYEVVEIGLLASDEEIAISNIDATLTGTLADKHFKEVRFLR